MTPRKRTVDRADPTPRKPRAKKPPRVTLKQRDILDALDAAATDPLLALYVGGPCASYRDQGSPRRMVRLDGDPGGSFHVEHLDGRAYVALLFRKMVRVEPYGEDGRWLRILRVVGEVRVR